MKNKKREILVTSALPYSNGSLHFGHVIETIQTDIWVRFQKSMGNDCLYICGADAHGTPIMLLAEKLGENTNKLINRIQAEQLRDYSDFQIGFDNFYTTHSEENQELANHIYQSLKDNDDIERRVITGAFDTQKNMFLPDRFVKGTCPKCGAADQYGDNCEACGATYSTDELIEPYSVLSNTKPEKKETEHLFFKLEKYQEFLKEWTNNNSLQPQVRNKLEEWFEAGLRQWDISRDAPYFGFKIPGEENKYFYVWLDAPIGYLASLKNYCSKNPNYNFEDYLKPDSNKEMYHFIGKDIVYFHALFWPAMLHGAGFKKPNAIFAHGFLTINGKKMSKSRGTFITARKYLDSFAAEYLRYYFAYKLSSNLDDIDLNLEDFVQRANSDLIGKLINLASRSSGFITRLYENKISNNLDQAIINRMLDKKDTIANLYESREYSKAMREIMLLNDEANKYVDEHKPWKLVKEESSLELAHTVCSTALNLFKILVTYLGPVLPEIAKKTQDFLNCEELLFTNIDNTLKNHNISKFEAMLQRLDLKEVTKTLISDDSGNNNSDNTKKGKPSMDEKKTISFDDFSKLDLRVVKILSAEEVENSDKLIKIVVDVGDGVKKQVFSGIKGLIKTQDIIGKQTLFVANLAPRKMPFGVSEGMLLFAGVGDTTSLLQTEPLAKPGTKVF